MSPNVYQGPKNARFHSAWDNRYVFLTSIHGQQSIHTTAGIMFQEIKTIKDPPELTQLPQRNPERN